VAGLLGWEVRVRVRARARDRVRVRPGVLGWEV